ncbi:MAG: hypothetical protein A3A90_01365 [Candidatus Zambryskibacteria bacterium RIFCSPLOWO2_01_FULL_35_19]|uniref:Uncharacterized protein n=1 Tax=Candidatus Zambryskibacteria bacterium RIFCSPLOWO2_01_FULL_35_19 TaxID=1802757 RepID=A0A1G2TVX7_9BACT|nr:MAG: hypothetical protein A2726_01505 [Candidatus Zambryskibacteria bacterium RIFCSPHIGHO2_01_FULL_35_32]OHB01475.1 MAG: hypothetical protein A3A90_01365 [Candidatus Zambryskibacteria bacterium RIFCSPLOWO2_01_FULL_35_19]
MFKFSKSFFKILIPIVVVIVLVMPMFVLAANGDGGGDTGGDGGGTTGSVPPINSSIEIKNPFKENTIEGLITTIIKDILIPIGSVVAVVMVMYAGFLFVTARGDAAQITKAKDALLWAVIGAAILLGAWIISQAIGKTISQLRV